MTRLSKTASALLVSSLLASIIMAQGQQDDPQPPPPDFFAGPGPGGGQGGPRFFGPMGGEETKLLKKFDKNADGWLNSAERQVAREFLKEERAEGRGGPQFGGRMGGPRRRGGQEEEKPQPGQKISQSDVKTYPKAPIYAPDTVRTFFLEFENADWEKELSDFHNTDVEVPAKLTVDGKSYDNVGIHFRGMSSYMGVGEGRKRSLNLSLDYMDKEQNLGGYRTLNLLNGHEDPSMLRAVLFYDIARDYIPAPKANFVRLVINGEDWGVYSSVQQFNKDLVNDWFGTTKGARWKVRGSPGGRGSLAYLGDNPEDYKKVYTIKSKDDPKSWAALINLCKVLNETPADKLEAALSPILDIDGALKFLALDNALINNDGYWIRTSDYSLYQDVKGKFHIIPQDANETFAKPGGPGGGMRFFGAAGMLVPQFFTEGDKNHDQKLNSDELASLAELWFGKLDANKQGKLSSDEFAEELSKALPQPGRFPGGPGGVGGAVVIQGGPGGPGGFGGGPGMRGPANMVAPALFKTSDQNADGSLTAAEMKETFSKWLTDWDKDKDKSLAEEELRTGLSSILPEPRSGPGGPREERVREVVGGPEGAQPRTRRFPPGGPDEDVQIEIRPEEGRRPTPGREGERSREARPNGGTAAGPQPQMRRMAGPGMSMPRVDGVKLDPLVAAKDENKPLISKLLAVPALRERYLSHVRNIAEKWLDWNKLGPIAENYHNLIADVVSTDTRKLDSTEDFEKSLTQDSQGGGGPRITISLKSFADQRREYLLNYKEGKSEAKQTP